MSRKKSNDKSNKFKAKRLAQTLGKRQLNPPKPKKERKSRESASQQHQTNDAQSAQDFGQFQDGSSVVERGPQWGSVALPAATPTVQQTPLPMAPAHIVPGATADASHYGAPHGTLNFPQSVESAAHNDRLLSRKRGRVQKDDDEEESLSDDETFQSSVIPAPRSTKRPRTTEKSTKAATDSAARAETVVGKSKGRRHQTSRKKPACKSEG